MNSVPGPTGGCPAWTARRIAAAVFFLIFLGIQVTVPIWKLGSDARPARYGWHMFSTFTVPVFYMAIASDGTVDTVYAQQHVARARPEIDFPRLLPQHLCAVLPGTETVIVRAGSITERRPCR